MSGRATCSRCSTPLDRGDLRCAICGQRVPRAAGSLGGPRAAVSVDVHRCAGCGAAVEYDPAVQAPRCAFCGKTMELERIVDPVEQTEAFLPFTVAAPEARAALRRWLGSLGPLRPSDLRSGAQVESLEPVWWVAWVFDAQALVSWTADSDAGSLSADWAPHAGQARMTFDDIPVSASRGLTHEETSALWPSYDLGTARPEAGDAEGARAEQFDVQRSAARRRILDAIDATAGARVEAEHVPGSRVRNLKLEILLSGLDTRRLALPAYVLAYRYRDALHRVVLSGQDAKVLTGSAPWSFAKIALLVLGILVALAAVGALIAVLFAIAASR